MTAYNEARRALDLGATAQEAIAQLWADVTQSQMAREEAAAKANPAAHRLSRVMERGKRTRYLYYGPIKVGGRKIRYCYATSRNVAGYYLAWREIETAKTVKRDMWTASKRRATVSDRMRSRHAAHKARLAK